jgi:hypothetical protein
LEYGDGWPGFAYEFGDDEETPDGWGRHLWLYDDEGASLECVVHLVRKFLERFRPHDCWSLTYAKTCSHPRIGEFGGGGIVVTANNTEWLSAYRWVEEVQAAAQGQAGRKTPEDCFQAGGLSRANSQDKMAYSSA